MNLRSSIIVLVLLPLLGGLAFGTKVELPDQNCQLDVPDGFSSSSLDDPHIVYSAKLQTPGRPEQVVSIYSVKSTLRADNTAAAAEIQDLCANKHLDVLGKKTTLISGRTFLVTNVASTQPPLAGVLFTTTTGNALVTLIFLKFPSTDQSMDEDLDAISLVNSLKLIKPLSAEQSGSYWISLSGMTILLICLGAYAGILFLRYFIGLFRE